MPRSLARFSVRLLSLTLGTALPGCNFIGPILYHAAGPQDIKASYKLPKERTLILVEHYGSANSDVAHDEMAQGIVEEFKEHNLAPTVPLTELASLRNDNPGQFSRMKVEEVGRALGASQVLYVHVPEARVETPAGSEMVKAIVTAKVKVVDAKTAQTRWPLDVPTYTINEETDYIHNAEGSEQTVRQGLMRKVAFETARLFYDHKTEYEIDTRQQ